MEQGHGGNLVAVTPYQFQEAAGRESMDQIAPLGARATALPADQISRSNTCESFSNTRIGLSFILSETDLTSSSSSQTCRL